MKLDTECARRRVVTNLVYSGAREIFSSGHGGSSSRDVASSKGAIFHLKTGDVYVGLKRVCFSTSGSSGRNKKDVHRGYGRIRYRQSATIPPVAPRDNRS